jgi:hypothetical protein
MLPKLAGGKTGEKQLNSVDPNTSRGALGPVRLLSDKVSSCRSVGNDTETDSIRSGIDLCNAYAQTLQR